MTKATANTTAAAAAVDANDADDNGDGSMSVQFACRPVDGQTDVGADYSINSATRLSRFVATSHHSSVREPVLDQTISGSVSQEPKIVRSKTGCQTILITLSHGEGLCVREAWYYCGGK